MPSCELCGRSPAKRMSFKAHQGFLVARRVVDYSGTYCRDHALQAYAAARGASLKGMWFSAGSLVFGTIGGIWESAKLLDLPEEVKDRPWGLHYVACPYCHGKNVCCSGFGECEACARDFMIASCMKCNSIHVLPESVPEKINFCCRKCSTRNAGIGTMRNWPTLLFALGVVETCAAVHDSSSFTETHQNSLAGDLRDAFGLQASFVAFAVQYLISCSRGRGLTHLPDCLEKGDERYRVMVLLIAVRFLASDGALKPHEISALQALADRLGLNLAEFLNQGRSQPYQPDPRSREWWTVLGVDRDAAYDEVVTAYRRLAVANHPDRYRTETEKASATQRLKDVLTAFESAKQELQKRTRRHADADVEARQNNAAPDVEPGDKRARKTSEADPRETPPEGNPNAETATSHSGGQEVDCERGRENPEIEVATESSDFLDKGPQLQSTEGLPSAGAKQAVALGIGFVLLYGIVVLSMNSGQSERTAAFHTEPGQEMPIGRTERRDVFRTPSPLLPQDGRADESAEIKKHQDRIDRLRSRTGVHQNDKQRGAPAPRLEPAFSQRNAPLVIPRSRAIEHAREAIAASEQRDFARAIDCYRMALIWDRRFTVALNNLAWLLSTCPHASLRNGNEALRLASEMYQLKLQKGELNWRNYGTLAAVYAEVGNFELAVEFQKMSVEHAPLEELEPARVRLALYRSGRAYRIE